MAHRRDLQRDCAGEGLLPLSLLRAPRAGRDARLVRDLPVCFWEDDGGQFRRPTMAGGANKVSLIEAQRNYQDFGACAEDEPLDPAWRPIDLTRDSFEDRAAEDRAPWPDDHAVLCWWLPTFWRRDHSAS
ncbi:CPCC family cysteine-rich protein [Streptomyces sp. NPDC003401]